MERFDLVTLGSQGGERGVPWADLPSDVRISLRSVELAFTAVSTMKMFKNKIVGRGISEDDFLKGVCSLQLLSDRLSGIFNGSLSDEGRKRIGQRILSFIDNNGQVTVDDFIGNGDSFAVKDMIQDWVRRDFGVAITPAKS